ncbi:MAG: metallophosphoesterase [Thermotogae bacterium]|nr:metallophosphoesterase [Thermotogota bacterium]
MRKITFLLFIFLVALTFSIFAYEVSSDDAAIWASKAGRGKTSFTFIVFGDNRGTSPARPLPPVLKQILKEIDLLCPDFAVNTGDILVGYTDTPEQGKAEVKEYAYYLNTYAPDVAHITVCGNHEDQVLPAFRERFGKKLYFDFYYGNSHFIVLNTVFNDHKRGIYNDNDGLHTLGQLDWLKKVMPDKQNTTHTFVFSHVPMYSALTPDFGPHPKCFAERENRDAVAKLFANNHIDAYIAGHEHLFYEEIHDGVRYITSGGGGAPIYAPVTGGAITNTGNGSRAVMEDPALDMNGVGQGYHCNVKFPAGALGIYNYILIKVNGDKVTYNVIEPYHFDYTYKYANDGSYYENMVSVANRTTYNYLAKGLVFIMPGAKKYEVTAHEISWSRKVVLSKYQPEVLEVKNLPNGKARVRVQVFLPAGTTEDVTIRAVEK